MTCFSGYPAGKREFRRPRAGFTLLELLVVIAIVTGLFAISLGAVRGSRERTAIARARSELALLATALEEFKRAYGDYPQTGASAAGSQRVDAGQGPNLDAAQAVLFNALAGVYGPRGSRESSVTGPSFIELSKLTLEVNAAAEDRDHTAVPIAAKSPSRNAFLDPWGNRYLYFYREGPRAAWSPSAYVLFSAGPDGEATLPSASGAFVDGAQSAGVNADNIYAGGSQ